MLHKSISRVFFQITLLLLCVSAGAVTLDDVFFQPSAAPQPPLALVEATINSEEEILNHDNVYQVYVQVKNTRPHEVDGIVELAAFSLLDSPVTLGYETVNLDSDGSTSLLFTFSPKDVVLPCTDYIFMVTTEPGSSTHINERDYIFVDERREFTFEDCTESIDNVDNDESISDTSMDTDEILSQATQENQTTLNLLLQETQVPPSQTTKAAPSIQTTEDPPRQMTEETPSQATQVTPTQTIEATPTQTTEDPPGQTQSEDIVN